MSKEPREFWLITNGPMKYRGVFIENLKNKTPDETSIIHVREVTGPDYKAIALELMGALEKSIYQAERLNLMTTSQVAKIDSEEIIIFARTALSSAREKMT